MRLLLQSTFAKVHNVGDSSDEDLEEAVIAEGVGSAIGASPLQKSGNKVAPVEPDRRRKLS